MSFARSFQFAWMPFVFRLEPEPYFFTSIICFHTKKCLMKESERRGAGLDRLVGFVFQLLISMVLILLLPLLSPPFFPLGESPKSLLNAPAYTSK
jgi:hypothetical protein